MTPTPRIITKAVLALAKWERELQAVSEAGDLTPRAGAVLRAALRRMASDMQQLRLELQATDARETRPDPSVRRRARSKKRGPNVA